MTEVTGYKLVIFDLDGTLLDTQEGVIQSLTKTLHEMGEKAVSLDLVKQFIGPPLLESFQRFFNYTEEQAKQGAEIFKRIYQAEGIYQAMVYPGVTETLKLLKERGIMAAVATNKTHENAVKILQAFQLHDYFDIIQGNQNQISKKDAIRICMERCRVLPKDCVLIGDSKQDEEGAKAFQMDFIAVTYGFGYSVKDAEQDIRCVHLCRDMYQVGRKVCGEEND